MVRIVPVRLDYNPRVLWFDPQGLELSDGMPVVVKTERGTEFGFCQDPFDASDEDVAKLKSKLKPVVRIATDDDLSQREELRRKGEEALPVFKRLAAETNEDMRPVMVEYLFGGDKAVFFFESEERVDFRELVRKLSAELGVRVDMRQIGVRDEARIIGGLGHCGQELCCKRLGGEFNPVSIRMAKEQDLSLNPQKISGLCGRLMCCLRYEYDAYKDFHGRAPKMNAQITTPAGCGKVCSLDVPREMITVRMEEDNKQVSFPLSAMDEAQPGARPNSIGEVFDEYANPDPFANSALLGSFDTAGFTREDKLATPTARHNPARDKDADAAEEGQGKRRRRRRSGAKKAQGAQGAQAKESHGEAAASQPKPERRRRRSGSSKQGEGASAAASRQGEGRKPSVRPGQKSSALSRSQGASGASQASAGQDAHRKARRRSHKAGGSGDEG